MNVFHQDFTVMVFWSDVETHRCWWNAIVGNHQGREGGVLTRTLLMMQYLLKYA